MKKVSIIIVLCLAIIGCKGNDKGTLENALASKEGQERQLKRYEVESGSVIYESIIAGKVMGTTISGTGSESLHFNKWGAVEVVEEATSQTTTAKMFGSTTTDKSSTHTMSKLNNGDTYSVDFKRKEIRKNNDMAMEMTKMFQKDADAGKVGKELFESMRGKLLGTEVILGYECEIWDLMGVKQWLYKGVLLKSEASLAGITTKKTATTATFNISVPGTSFDLPDFPIIEEENFMAHETFDVDVDEMKKDMERIKDMSYEDWKEMATMDDEEMQAMSEEELKQMYNTMQKMIRMQQ